MFFPKFISQIQSPLRFPIRQSNTKTTKFHLITGIIDAALTMNNRIKQLLDLNINNPNFSIAQTPIREKLDLEGKAVVLNGGIVDGESHGEIPAGVGAGVFVDGGFLFLVV
uniref:Uncharacterized protein n=1 Tax=Cucumis sativus TaxID=3659 RepID=A0A0A0M1J1_CUCSA